VPCVQALIHEEVVTSCSLDPASASLCVVLVLLTCLSSRESNLPRFVSLVILSTLPFIGSTLAFVIAVGTHNLPLLTTGHLSHLRGRLCVPTIALSGHRVTILCRVPVHVPS
jgi:hypothetical protein